MIAVGVGFKLGVFLELPFDLIAILLSRMEQQIRSIAEAVKNILELELALSAPSIRPTSLQCRLPPCPGVPVPGQNQINS